jgi:hypothetical protein
MNLDGKLARFDALLGEWHDEPLGGVPVVSDNWLARFGVVKGLLDTFNVVRAWWRVCGAHRVADG